jgi:hypothetical protein
MGRTKDVMSGRAILTSDWRKRACRLVGVIVLGAMLGGCDKCGDWWFSPLRGESQMCRDQAPKPQ